MKLNQFQWLEKEPGPRMLLEALKLFGTTETPGAKDNPVILEWAKELGISNIYTHDETPWCGLFMGVVAKRAGKELPKSPLWALDWLNFGVPVKRPMLGDVLVLTRKGGGHVTLYIGEDEETYLGLGGNQSDAVNISRVLKERVTGFRRPKYNTQPSNVRVIKLDSHGLVINNKEE